MAFDYSRSQVAARYRSDDPVVDGIVKFYGQCGGWTGLISFVGLVFALGLSPSVGQCLFFGALTLYWSTQVGVWIGLYVAVRRHRAGRL